jgi:hypothetical protein
MVTLAAVDRVFLGSMLANQTQWTIINGAFWTAIAYLIGQIIAIPSAALLEHLVGRKLLRAPSSILLGLDVPRWRENAVRLLFGAREYEPLPLASRNSVLSKVAAGLQVPVSDVDAESGLPLRLPTRSRRWRQRHTAGQLPQSIRHVPQRLLRIAAGRWADDVARQQYRRAARQGAGDRRASARRRPLRRFIKFYAAYSREVFRTYDKCVPVPDAQPPAPANP